MDCSGLFENLLGDNIDDFLEYTKRYFRDIVHASKGCCAIGTSPLAKVRRRRRCCARVSHTCQLMVCRMTRLRRIACSLYSLHQQQQQQQHNLQTTARWKSCFPKKVRTAPASMSYIHPTCTLATRKFSHRNTEASNDPALFLSSLELIMMSE